MQWIRFRDRMPTTEDYPFWIYDSEFNTIEFVKSVGDRILSQQWCVKDELSWQKAKVASPILPSPKE